ncbi:MAG: hypothetical protein QE487_14190 [Fluviicola sp.]|nr:hypothetical protein [Fluviicola sp.]
MKKILSLFAILSINLSLQAQTWTFAGAGGSANAENGKAICVDATGNVYVTGSFSNTVDFDLGAGTANLTSNGSNDIFIASYTSAGVYRWAVRAGGIAADNGSPNGGICTDGVNVYVTGSYNGAATAFGATNLTPNGGSGIDAFVAKLNCTTGAWTWAVSMGGTGNVDTGVAMCLDPSGNPYLLGSFNLTMSGACGNVSLGGSDIFVSRLNPTTGACVWMASGGSTTNDGTLGGGICYDLNTTELVVASTTNTGLATFGGFNVTSVGGIDMCVLELNSATGAWLGAVGSGSATTDDAIACAYDPSTTNVMVCGAFTNNMTLPGGIPLTASSAGIQDAWWGSYSVSTNGFVWARAAVGTGLDRANGIAVDGNGSVLITGQYVTNPTTFNGLPLTNTNSAAFDDLFVVKYAAGAGTVQWVTKNTNTAGPQTSLAAGRAIAFAGSNNYWITGQSTVGTTFNVALPSNGFADLFVAKLNIPAALPVELSSFTIDCEDDHEQLNWTSESEYRFDYYEIEKSYDLNDFTSLGIVDVIGESTVTQHYSFDLPSEDENTLVYYRLKMVDQDGTAEFSDLISGVFCDFDNQGLLKSYGYDGGVLTLQLVDSDAKVELFTITGQLIHSPQEINESMREIRINSNGQQVYILRITAADGSQTIIKRIFF